MSDKVTSKVKRLGKRVLRNTRTLLMQDINASFVDQSQQIAELSKQVSTLSDENLFLLRTCFSQDQWLAQAKDMHKGERCFLLGCGPSLNKVDLSRLRRECTMGVNGTFMIESLQLDYFVTVSNRFWKPHVEALQRYCCRKRRFLPHYLRELESDCPTTWLTTIEPRDHRRVEESIPWFFSTSASQYVVLGGTVISVCLQILYHLGFSEVILLGIDHDYGLKKEDAERPGGLFVSGENFNVHHFTPDYFPKDGDDMHIDIVAMERAYELSHEAFKNAGRKVLNASPGTKLETFPKVRLEDVV